VSAQLSSKPFFSRLAFLAFSLAFIVILLGAYTRLTNAGLSCPDWPRCYGYLTPPSSSDQLLEATKAYPQVPVDKARAWTEMRHRYLAGFEGLLILALITLAWRLRKELPPLAFKLTQALIVIMLGQVLLGMLTVTALLKPVVVLGHLLFGFSVMSILWLVYWLTQKPYPVQNPNRLKPWLNLGLVILVLQITLGGWVSTHYAGLACVDFPYCQGSLLPSLQWKALHSDLITIHMLHRIGALFTFIYLGFLSLALIRQKANRHFGFMLLSLLNVQIILGILNIVWLRPVEIALPHHAVAALLLLTLLATVVNVYRQRNPA
jgi:cytochrome c oxidase assembly protein subunit 15